MFQVRERLVSQDVNRESLLAIDSSIGLFSIEDETPKVRMSLCIIAIKLGTEFVANFSLVISVWVHNRWFYDGNICFILCSDINKNSQSFERNQNLFYMDT